MALRHSLPVAFLLAALFAGCARARISITSVKADRRATIQMADYYGSSFGFAGNYRGKIDVTIRNVSVYGEEDVQDWERFGFFLYPVAPNIALQQDYDRFCVLDELPNLFTFKDSNIQQLIQGDIPEYTFRFTINGGRFYLYFANCETTVPVSFTVRVEMYNLDDDGNKDYQGLGYNSSPSPSRRWNVWGWLETVWGWLKEAWYWLEDLVGAGLR